MASRDRAEAGKSGWNASLMVPIIVALITVVGGVATAVVANWDKIFGGDMAAAAPPRQTGAGTVAAPGLDSVSAQKGAAQQLSEAQQGAYGAAAGALDDVTRQIQGAGQQAVSIDVTGRWSDTDGYQFDFRQRGAAISFEQYTNGERSGEGAGQISGRALRYDYKAGDDSGACTGQLSADGKVISGRCRSQDGNSWPFSVQRQQ